MVIPCHVVRACEALTDELAAAAAATTTDDLIDHNDAPEEGQEQQRMMITLSARQIGLHISKHLVYLHGLTMSDHSSSTCSITTDDDDNDESTSNLSYTKDQQALFVTLQKRYNEKKPSQQQRCLYQLSPTLQPSPSDQRTIQQAVLDQLNKQNRLHEEATLRLLQEEASQDKQARSKRKTKKQSKGGKQQAEQRAVVTRPRTGPLSSCSRHENNEDDTSGNSTTSSSSDEESFLSQQQRPVHDVVIPQHLITFNDEEVMNDNDDWIPVGVERGGVRSSHSPSIPRSVMADNVGTRTTTSVTKQKKSVTKQKEVTLVDDAGTKDSATDTCSSIARPTLLDDGNEPNPMERIASPPSPLPPTSVEEQEQQNGSPATLPSDNSTDEGAAADDHGLLFERMKDQLKRQQDMLLEKDRQLHAQEQDVRQQLRKARDQADERVQALQLRLYISETKLKTYQDALEDHIHAVAHTTTTNRHDDDDAISTVFSSSPERRRLTEAKQEGGPSFSPLGGKRPWMSSSSPPAGATAAALSS